LANWRHEQSPEPQRFLDALLADRRFPAITDEAAARLSSGEAPSEVAEWAQDALLTAPDQGAD
jgi:hypothetical protein